MAQRKVKIIDSSTIDAIKRRVKAIRRTIEWKVPIDAMSIRAYLGKDQKVVSLYVIVVEKKRCRTIQQKEIIGKEKRE